VKCLFSTAPEVRKETEANGGHYGDWTRSRFDWTRPVSSQQLSGARVSGFLTGRWSGLPSASGQFTCAQKKHARPTCPVPHGTGASGQASRGGRAQQSADRTRDASGHVRSDVSGRGGSLLDSNRTLGAARPVKR
jgi:hypothetical protein